jgi:hypothetical protein
LVHSLRQTYVDTQHAAQPYVKVSKGERAGDRRREGGADLQVVGVLLAAAVRVDVGFARVVQRNEVAARLGERALVLLQALAHGSATLCWAMLAVLRVARQRLTPHDDGQDKRDKHDQRDETAVH